MGPANRPVSGFGVSKLFTPHVEEIFACFRNALEASFGFVINKNLRIQQVLGCEMSKETKTRADNGMCSTLPYLFHEFLLRQRCLQS
jgi:hypothetical protein